MKLEQIYHSLKKEANAAPPPPQGVGASFLSGAKSSLPWSLGFWGLGRLMSPEYQTPGEKTRGLARDLIGGAAGFGAWSAASDLVKNKLDKLKNKGKYFSDIDKLPKYKFLKSKPRLQELAGKASRFGKKTLLFGVPAFAAGMGASILSDKILDKFFPRQEKKKYIVLDDKFNLVNESRDEE